MRLNPFTGNPQCPTRTRKRSRQRLETKAELLAAGDQVAALTYERASQDKKELPTDRPFCLALR